MRDNSCLWLGVKIALFIDSLGSGGAQRQVTELAKCLAGDGVDTTIVLYFGDLFFASELEDTSVKIVNLAESKKNYFGFLRALRRELRKYDLVHSFLHRPNFWAATALRTFGRHGPLHVASERSSNLASSFMSYLIQLWGYRNADHCVANSPLAKDLLVQRIGISPSKVSYIPNGIDFTSWDTKSDEASTIPVEPKKLQLALVAALRPEKQHFMLLHAVQKLDQKYRKKLDILFVGNPNGWLDHAASVVSSIESMSLGDVVRYHPAVKNIAPVMRQLDGVVLCSKVEGFPNVLLEGAASECFLIAPNIGAVKELLISGKNGILVERQSEDAWVSVLESILNIPPASLEEMKKFSNAHVRARFAMNKVSQSYRDLYSKLLEES